MGQTRPPRAPRAARETVPLPLVPLPPVPRRERVVLRGSRSSRDGPPGIAVSLSPEPALSINWAEIHTKKRRNEGVSGSDPDPGRLRFFVSSCEFPAVSDG